MIVKTITVILPKMSITIIAFAVLSRFLFSLVLLFPKMSDLVASPASICYGYVFCLFSRQAQRK